MKRILSILAAVLMCACPAQNQLVFCGGVLSTDQKSISVTAENKVSYVIPTKAEIYQAMVVTGKKYNIPPEILYALANQESDIRQFYEDGTPNISFDNGIGIMQVTPGHVSQNFDVDKLKYDYKYNIDAGAQVLLEKWNWKNSGLIPTVGNGDPKVLENWYFALWAYNSYSYENNPNCLPLYIARAGYTKKIAYQDSVISRAKNELGINITPIPKSQLPKTGIPAKGSKYSTPTPMHYSQISDIKDYSDYVKELYLSDMNFDKTGDGIKDAHYCLTLELPQSEKIKSIRIYSALLDGSEDGRYLWKSDGSGLPLLLFQNGRKIDITKDGTQDSFVGNNSFDIYTGNALNTEKGCYYHMEMILSDGKKVDKIINANSTIKDFTLMDKESDKVGDIGVFSANGVRDAHFAINVNAINNVNIKSIDIWNTDQNGNINGPYSWSTSDSTKYPISAFNGTTNLNQSYTNNLGSINGNSVIDLYCNDKGTFDESDYQLVRITLSDGSKITKLFNLKTKIKQLTLETRDEDLTSETDMTKGDGTNDAHLKMSVDLAESTEIKTLKIITKDAIYSTKPQGGKVVAVYYNKYSISNNFGNSLGIYNGLVNFDLYINNESKFRTGDKLSVQLELGNGSKVYKDFIVNDLSKDSNINSGRSVVIDPGDGGKYSGVTSNGIVEKTLNLDIANRLKSKLESSGIKVYMTRTNDTFVEIPNRDSFSNKTDADFFISLHGNSASRAGAKGIECIYNPYDSSGAKLRNRDFAQIVQNEVDKISLAKRQLIERNSDTLLNGSNKVSATVEYGFLTNSEEAALLKTDSYKEKIADSISYAIKSSFDLIGKPAQKAPEIKGFNLTSRNEDKVGIESVGSPDGFNDSKFELLLSLPTSAEVKSIELYTVDNNGIYNGKYYVSTKDSSKWILSAASGNSLNNGYVSSIGTFSGDTKFDLYSTMESLLCKGQKVMAQVTLGDGTKLNKVLDITDGQIENSRVVVIDPGHGEQQIGVSANGIIEKNMNLEIAQKLKASLEAKGLKVYMTRSQDKNMVANVGTDYNTELLRRAKFINGIMPDFVVSIHGNASDNGTGTGIEMLYNPVSSSTNKVSNKDLAAALQSELNKIATSSRNALSKDNNVLLNNVKVPSAIVEYGFITTPGEAQKLQTDNYKNMVVYGISNGVYKAYGTLGKGLPAQVSQMSLNDFRLLSRTEDKIGTRDSGTPNGVADAKFKLILNFSDPMEIKTIRLFTVDASGNKSGVYDFNTADNAFWMLGVFKDGVQLNKNHVSTLGKYLGDIQFDLYADEATALKKGKMVQVQVTLGNGTVLNKTIQIVDGPEDVPKPKPETPAAPDQQAQTTGSNSSGYTTITLSRVLKLTSPMMHGDDVAAVQERLNAFGYNCGGVDGWFGNATNNAVRSFQKNNGLDVDGQVGPMTLKALNKGSSSETQTTTQTQQNQQSQQTTTQPQQQQSNISLSRILRLASPMMHGDDVAAVQTRLNSLGFSCGTADGWFGNATNNAVIAFQRSKGLDVDGQVGPMTLNALNGGAVSTPAPAPTPTPTTPSTSSSSLGSRTLRLTSPMMHGDDVAELQNKLNNLGYNCGSADGWFGSATDSAVRWLQSDRGLDSDGIVGPQTVNSILTNNTKASSGSSGGSSGVVGNASGVVVIDPGHGGPEPGAEYNGIVEKTLNLEISLGLRSRLQQRGVKVYMTRTADAYLNPSATWYGPELSARCRYINSIGPNYLLSVHANAADATSARGPETLYNPNGSWSSHNLANIIQSCIINATGAYNRGTVPRTNLMILNGTDCPAALVEVGFISNYMESNNLKSYSYKQKIMDALCQAIINALK